MHLKSLSIFAIIPVFLFGLNAHADEIAARSETSSSSFTSKLTKHITASVRFEGYGPATTDWTGYRPNVDKGLSNDRKQEAYSKNKLYLGYKFNESQSAGVGLQVYYLSYSGDSFKDPYIFVRDSHFVQSGGYNFDAALRLYAGVSADAKKYNTPMGIRFVQDSTYKTGTPLTLGFFSEMHWYTLSKRVIGARELEFFLVPNVDIKIATKWTANLALKIWAYHNVGKNLFDLVNDPVLLSPGFTYSPIKTVAINPYLDFATRRFAWNMTTVGLNLNWKIL